MAWTILSALLRGIGSWRFGVNTIVALEGGPEYSSSRGLEFGRSDAKQNPID